MMDAEPGRHLPPPEPELLPEAAPCPFCDGTDTELVSPFGGQLSVAQYWCRRCRTAFEFIKWGGDAAG